MTLNSDNVATSEVVAGIERLEAGAEMYTVLWRTEDRRVALIARKDGGSMAFTLEVQIRLVSTEAGRELSGLTEAARRTELLLSRGYTSGKQEEAWVCCEKGVDMGALDDEMDTVLRTEREC